MRMKGFVQGAATLLPSVMHKYIGVSVTYHFAPMCWCYTNKQKFSELLLQAFTGVANIDTPCLFKYYYLNCLFRFLQFKIFTIFFMEQHCAHTTVNMRVFKRYHNSGTRLGTVTES